MFCACNGFRVLACFSQGLGQVEGHSSLPVDLVRKEGVQQGNTVLLDRSNQGSLFKELVGLLYVICVVRELSLPECKL